MYGREVNTHLCTLRSSQSIRSLLKNMLPYPCPKSVDTLASPWVYTRSSHDVSTSYNVPLLGNDEACSNDGFHVGGMADSHSEVAYVLAQDVRLFYVHGFTPCTSQ